MALKTLVKVGEVNNLSDARYCAGMGVEMIGFSLDNTTDKSISSEKALEIINWLSGVQLVGEFENAPAEIINELSQKLHLNYIQIPENYPGNLKIIGTPIILKTNFSDISRLSDLLNQSKSQIAYFLIESNESLQSLQQELIDLSENYPIIIGFDINKETLPLIIETIKPSGISLKGGHELKPGLKDFEDLAGILEELEENDY